MEPQYIEEMIDKLTSLRCVAQHQSYLLQKARGQVLDDTYEAVKNEILETTQNSICQAVSDQDSHQRANLTLVYVALLALFAAIQQCGVKKHFLKLYYFTHVEVLSKEIGSLKAIRDEK